MVARPAVLRRRHPRDRVAVARGDRLRLAGVEQRAVLAKVRTEVGHLVRAARMRDGAHLRGRRAAVARVEVRGQPAERRAGREGAVQPRAQPRDPARVQRRGVGT
eukprot:3381100-Prymnesium_polylepis.1